MSRCVVVGSGAREHALAWGLSKSCEVVVTPGNAGIAAHGITCVTSSPLELEADGQRLSYSFDAKADDTGIPKFLKLLGEIGIDYKDLDTSRSSLEDIFVSLVENPA